MSTKTRNDRLLVNFLVPRSFNNCISDFLTDREVRGNRPATLKYHMNELGYFSEWASKAGAQTIDDITPDLLRAYFLALGKRRNATGVHDAYRSIRTWLNWAWIEYDMQGKCPFTKVKVETPTFEAKEGISLEDVGKLLAACEDGRNATRDRAIILLLLDTGLRRREVCALNVGCFRRNAIRLEADGTKTGNARSAFLSRESLKALRSYLGERHRLTEESPLFASAGEKRLSVSGLRQIIRRLCEKAGIPETGLHGFRRCFALETFRASKDLESTSRLLGHKNVTTTRRYLALDDDDLREVHKRTSPVDKLLRQNKNKQQEE